VTNQQLEAMHKEAQKLVQVSCCDYHQHSARQDCLSGDPMAILVCILCEELRATRAGIKRLYESTEPKGEPVRAANEPPTAAKGGRDG